MHGANQMGVTNGEKMNLQVGGPTNTIVLTENRTGVTLIMDLTLYQLGHASTTFYKRRYVCGEQRKYFIFREYFDMAGGMSWSN
jgi:hypothetical protein